MRKKEKSAVERLAVRPIKYVAMMSVVMRGKSVEKMERVYVLRNRRNVVHVKS